MTALQKLSDTFPGLRQWTQLPSWCAFAGIAAGCAITPLHIVLPISPLYFTLYLIATFFLLLALLLTPHTWYGKLLLGAALGGIVTGGSVSRYNAQLEEIRELTGSSRVCTGAGVVHSVPAPTMYGWRWEAHIDSLVNEQGTTVARNFKALVTSDSCPQPAIPFLWRGTFATPSHPSVPGAFNEYTWQMAGARLGRINAYDLQMLDNRIVPPFFKALNRLRTHARTTLSHLGSAQHRAILAAAFLGIRELDQQTSDIFRHAGLSHLLALSGLHVGILTAFLLVLLAPLPIPRPSKLLLTLPALWGYAALTGVGPSLFRAVLMASLGACALLVERKTKSLNLLGFAGCAWLLSSPASIHSPAFQLSWGATAGIILFYPWLRTRFPQVHTRVPPAVRPFADAFLVSGSAFLVTLPILAWHFGEISLFGLFANIFKVFLMAAAVWAFTAAQIVEIFFPPAAALILQVSSLLLTALVSCASLSYLIPAAVVAIPRPPLVVCGVFGFFLIGLATLRAGKTGTYLHLCLVIVLTLTPALLLRAKLLAPDALVAIVPVSQSNLIVMSPNGRHWHTVAATAAISPRKLDRALEPWLRTRSDYCAVFVDSCGSPGLLARYGALNGYDTCRSVEAIPVCSTAISVSTGGEGTSWQIRVTKDTLYLDNTGTTEIKVPLPLTYAADFALVRSRWIPKPSLPSTFKPKKGSFFLLSGIYRTYFAEYGDANDHTQFGFDHENKPRDLPRLACHWPVRYTGVAQSCRCAPGNRCLHRS